MADILKTGLFDLLTYCSDNPLLFNSGQFLLLFTAFISLYAIIYKTNYARAVYIILFSLFFYYKSSGFYFVLLFGSIFYNYGIGYVLHELESKFFRRFILVISVVVNLSLLGYYKYTNFLIDNISYFSGKTISAIDIFLPVGISFFTFQALSYVIDIYRREFKPEYNLLDFAFFLSFFPQLVAGPIVRAHRFLPQLKKKIAITSNDISVGLFLIMQG